MLLQEDVGLGYASWDNGSMGSVGTDEGKFLPKWASVFQASVLAFICITALVSNFIVSYTLVKKDQLLIPSNRLVFSLTSSNFALALLVLPFAVASSALQEWRFGVFWCDFTAFFALLIGSSTFLTVGVIALDRYYIIVKPMLYAHIITNSRMSCILFAVWFFSFLCALPPYFGWSEFRYREGICMVDWSYNAVFTAFVIGIAVLPPFITVIVCYYLIFKLARTMSRKVHVGIVSEVARDLQLAPAPPIRRLSTRRWSLSVRKPSSLLPSFASPNKGLRTVCVVVGVFTITCIPYVSVAITEAASGCDILPSWFRILALWLALFSIATHPVVYGLYNRSIRKQLRGLFPTSSHVLRGLPRTNSHRLSISASISASISGSVFDYSPFKFRGRRNSRRTSMDCSHTGLDNSARTISSRRKGSHDSGAVVTDSDADTEPPFFSLHRWRRRFSAPSQMQFYSATQEVRPSQLSSLPLLQSLASVAASTSGAGSSQSNPLDSATTETSFVFDDTVITVDPADTLFDIAEKDSPNEQSAEARPTTCPPMDAKVFLRTAGQQTSVDEGISLASDCTLEELE